jgi:hypothetical protein
VLHNLRRIFAIGLAELSVMPRFIEKLLDHVAASFLAGPYLQPRQV